MNRLASPIGAALAVLLAGCAHNSTTVLSDKKIEAEKVVALDAPRAPWVTDIETSLRKAGFRVLRWASQKKVTEGQGTGKVEQYQAASTRYVLVIDGQAFTDPLNRCFGGGWKFSYLNADLVDTASNETVLSVTGSGFSENCPPLSGRLFTNISEALTNAWQDAAPRQIPEQDNKRATQ